MRPLLARCHLDLGAMERRQGHPQEATAHLARAAALFHEMGMASWLARAEAELAALG